jgi:hypothetical protein
MRLMPLGTKRSWYTNLGHRKSLERNVVSRRVPSVPTVPTEFERRRRCISLAWFSKIWLRSLSIYLGHLGQLGQLGQPCKHWPHCVPSGLA